MVLTRMTILIGFYPKHQDSNQGIGERYSIRATRGFVAQGTEISLKLKCKIWGARESDETTRKSNINVIDTSYSLRAYLG